MKLAVVVPVLGQHALATQALKLIVENKTNPATGVFVVDNGGDFAPPKHVTVIKPKHNLGVYPVFEFAFQDPLLAEYDIIAFLHSDLFVVEEGYDEVILANMIPSDVGLVGFIGSNEIDRAGGRGGGTAGNFKGGTYFSGYTRWVGSPAEAHGRRITGSMNAAVVDGCAMVIRREAWRKIGYREDFPPHHFYDRLISTQMLEAGYRVEVLGVACDHISGQTVGGQAYVDFAEKWSRANLSPDKWVGNPPNYAWDQTVYQEAERQWLTEYRNNKHLIPIKV